MRTYGMPILCFLLVGFVLSGCRGRGPAYPKRDLGDFEMATRSDSSGAAQKIQGALHTEPPLRIDRIGSFWDGGSIGGRFVDARNETLRFSLSRQMDDRHPGYLYIGAEHASAPKARRLTPGSEEEKAVVAALLLYGGKDQAVSELANILTGAPGYRNLRGSAHER